ARADCVDFFLQAEDGIRDDLVTGVQTCALPISATLKCSRAISSFTSPFTNRTRGISCSTMNRSTALTYSPPIRPSTTGDGIGNRSEERRVGKECEYRRAQDAQSDKQ